MSEIVERVARASCKADGFDPDDLLCSGSDDLLWTSWVPGARAAIEAMREPTVQMVAAAFPCEANEAFSHEDKCLGAAVCLRLGGGANVGLLEGEAVKQAAFLARDYRIMIDAALKVQP
jgi:hypothetical protein